MMEAEYVTFDNAFPCSKRAAVCCLFVSLFLDFFVDFLADKSSNLKRSLWWMWVRWACENMRTRCMFTMHVTWKCEKPGEQFITNFAFILCSSHFCFEHAKEKHSLLSTDCVTMFSMQNGLKKAVRKPNRTQSIHVFAERYFFAISFELWARKLNIQQAGSIHYINISLCLAFHLYFDFMVFNEFLSSQQNEIPFGWCHSMADSLPKHRESYSAFWWHSTNAQTHQYIRYIVWRFGVFDAKATKQINCIIRIWAVAMNESEKRTVSDWLDSV